MRHHFMVSFAGAVLWAAGCASAPTPPPIGTAAPPIDPYLQIVERVADNVHVMRQAQTNFAGVVGNVVIIEQTDNIVLVDSGANRGTGQRVVDAVRRISDKPVSAVIITHWHNDHPLGLPAILAAWPDAEIIATEATRIRLAEGRTNVPLQRDAAYEAGRHQLLTQDFVTRTETAASNLDLSQAERDGWARARRSLDLRVNDEPGTYLILPTRTFADRLALPDSRTPIEILFAGRANTDGDAVIWLPRQRVLVAGDAVVWPLPYEFSVYPEENIATIERLRAYDYAVLVPGHGEPMRDKSYLGLLIAFMRQVRAEVAPLAQRGLTLEEVTERVQIPEFAQHFTGGDGRLTYWFERYTRLPLIESAYKEAKGEPLGPAPVAPAP